MLTDLRLLSDELWLEGALLVNTFLVDVLLPQSPVPRIIVEGDELLLVHLPRLDRCLDRSNCCFFGRVLN